MDNTEIESILQILGKHVPPASQLTLVGGSVLALLGSPRLNIDIDFIGDDIPPANFTRPSCRRPRSQFDFHPDTLAHLQEWKIRLK